MYEESNFNKGCITIVALPFTLKSILRQKKKKNYGKLKYISPCKKYNLPKNCSKKKPKSFKIL